MRFFGSSHRHDYRGVQYGVLLEYGCLLPPTRRIPARMSACFTRAIILLCLSLISSLVTAHMIEVPAGKKECFFEDLHVNDKVRRTPFISCTCYPYLLQMTVTYQVGGGGHLDIDFWVSLSLRSQREKLNAQASCQTLIHACWRNTSNNQPAVFLLLQKKMGDTSIASPIK